MAVVSIESEVLPVVGIGFVTITPETVHYRVDCLTTQKQITDWTELSTGTTADISITTAIRRDFNRTERKRLTVSADKDTDNEVIGTAHWIVVNLAGIR